MPNAALCLPPGACSLLLLWIGLPLAAFALARGQRMNYLEPLVPAAAILAGIAWSRLGADPAAAARPARAMALASAGVLIAIGAGLLGALGLWSPPEDLEIAADTMTIGAAGGAGLALAGLAAWLALRRGRMQLAAGAFLAGIAGLWALSLLGIGEHLEQHSSRATCRWLQAHRASGEPVMLYRDYVHSAGFYLGERLDVVRPCGDTKGWAGSWPDWPGRAETPDEPRLAELARSGRGVWLIAKSRKGDDLPALARRHGLGLELRRVGPDVVLGRLGPAEARRP